MSEPEPNSPGIHPLTMSTSSSFDPEVNNDPPFKAKRQSVVDITPLHPGARYALFVLTFINLFNYIDRYVPSATKTMFQEDLELTETETSLPLTAFILVYLVTSPIFGYASDHGWSRKKLIAFGVCLWSIATATAALSNNFGTLMFTRAMVGVGEAAYATIAPSVLSDYYPAKERNRILSFFYIAIPVGAALGYGLGGAIAGAFGWRVAFCAVGIPGVFLSILCLFIHEAPRGAQDTAEDANAPPPASLKEALIELPKNQHYMVTVMGMTAVTFGAGGMADWFPTYLERNAYYPDGSGVGTTGAALAVGGVTVIGGIVGTSLGAFLGEWMKKRGYRQAYLSLSAVGMAITTAMVALGLILPQNLYLLVFLLLVAQICLWLYIGPLNALIANCVPARVRTRSFALSIFITHALGDAISPAIIGGISDATNNLRKACTIVPISFGIGALIWVYGWLRLPELPVENVVFAPASTDEPKTADGNPVITVHRLSQIMGAHHPSHRHSAEMVVVGGGLGGSVVLPNTDLLQADADAADEDAPASDTRLL